MRLFVLCWLEELYDTLWVIQSEMLRLRHVSLTRYSCSRKQTAGSSRTTTPRSIEMPCARDGPGGDADWDMKVRSMSELDASTQRQTLMATCDSSGNSVSSWPTRLKYRPAIKQVEPSPLLRHIQTSPQQ